MNDIGFRLHDRKIPRPCENYTIKQLYAVFQYPDQSMTVDYTISGHQTENAQS